MTKAEQECQDLIDLATRKYPNNPPAFQALLDHAIRDRKRRDNFRSVVLLAIALELVLVLAGVACWKVLT